MDALGELVRDIERYRGREVTEVVEVDGLRLEIVDRRVHGVYGALLVGRVEDVANELGRYLGGVGQHRGCGHVPFVGALGRWLLGLEEVGGDLEALGLRDDGQRLDDG